MHDREKDPAPATLSPPARRTWITRTVVGIVLATFFSDASHEMATAVLPLYLSSIGLGPAALGVIEGVADLLASLSKLAGGVVGHRVREKRPLASLAYLATTLSTAGMGLVHTAAGFVSLRSLAWIGRGFRGPLRDHILADAVLPTHYGRAYGFERAGDMLGAVVGPLVATLLVWASFDLGTVILWSLLPGLAAAGAMFFLAREPRTHAAPPSHAARAVRPPFPRKFLWFTGAVLLFGLGDFSRTFLIWLAAGSMGESRAANGSLSIAVLLYVLHNGVAAASAYPIGQLGDRRPKNLVLLGGYVLGGITNVLLASGSTSLGWLVLSIVLSGITISVEETIEKAAAVEMLPRELRSLGLGILACANAVGDMVSSLYVGILLDRGERHWAFGSAALLGFLGALWLFLQSRNGGARSVPTSSARA
jgi:MFS family permease